MPQSLAAVYIHLVFSTKNRRPFLRDKPIRDSLHVYLGGISKELGCAPIITGGVEDHIHQLVHFGRTITQADWIKELKRSSTSWIRKQYSEQRKFEWQTGYSTFSVSPSKLDHVIKYISNQEKHHHKNAFQDELRILLKKHNLKWDERHVWD